MRSIRALSAALLVALAVLVPAGAASAHDQLVGTDPEDGARIATAPAKITLTFNEPALKLGSVIRVLGPDGANVATGDSSFVDEDVTQPIRPGLAAGKYRIEWQVTSADGHPIAGRLSFTVTQGVAATTAPATTAAPTVSTPAATPAPTAVAPATDESDGSSVSTPLVFAVIAVALIALVVGAALLARRRGSGT